MNGSHHAYLVVLIKLFTIAIAYLHENRFAILIDS